MSMTQNKKMKLLGEIMQRCGALGDASLAGMLGELMSELSSEPDSTARTTVEGCKYVLCVEATLQNGTKVQHPVIGGNVMPTKAEDFKMTISDNLISLQRDTECMKSMIENRFPVKVRVVPVTDESIESLQSKLSELIDNLMEMIQEAADAKAAAYQLMNVELESEDITNQMLSDVMRKTIYAGACLTEAGEVVDRTDEKYVEEEKISEADNFDDEDDYDEDYEECDFDCDNCDYCIECDGNCDSCGCCD